jgi:hypothetical protein
MNNSGVRWDHKLRSRLHPVLKRKDLRHAALSALCDGGECDLEHAMPRRNDACCGKQYDAALLSSSLQHTAGGGDCSQRTSPSLRRARNTAHRRRNNLQVTISEAGAAAERLIQARRCCAGTKQRRPRFRRWQA